MRVPKSFAKYIDVATNPGMYIRIEIERVKGNFQKKATDIITKVAVFAAMGIVGLFVLVFGSVTLGLYLNDVLESSSLGFLIVTGFYVLILVILLLISDKEKIARRILGFAKNNVTLTLKEADQFEQTSPPPPSNGQNKKNKAVKAEKVEVVNP